MSLSKVFCGVAAMGLSIAAFCSSINAAPLVAGGALVAPGEPDPVGGVVQPGTGGAVAFSSPPGPGAYSGTLQTPFHSEDRWRKMMAEPADGDYLLLAFVEGRIAGHAGIHPVGKSPRRAHSRPHRSRR